MSEISPKHIEEFKRIYKEEHGKDLTDAEAYDGARGLVQLAEIIFKQMQIDHQRKQRLEKEPRGFHLEEGSTYSCCICYQQVSGKETWYDQYGIKCMVCQKALKDKVVPKYICTNRDLWLADWELQSKFGMHSATMRKLIRNGTLHPRIIRREDGTTHFQLFIIKENQVLLKTSD